MKTRLRVVIEAGEETAGYEPRRVDGPADVYEECQDLVLADRERFHVLHVNVRNEIVAREEVAVGTLVSTLLTPREVFKGAMLHNAAAIILVHNHPSGDPMPSEADLTATERLAEAGAILGIPVLDHVIVARSGWRSIPITAFFTQVTAS